MDAYEIAVPVVVLGLALVLQRRRRARWDAGLIQQSQSPVRPLHGADGAGVRILDARKAELSFRSLLERAAELTDERAHDLRAELAVVAEQGSEAPGQGTDPMPNAHARQHTLFQVDRRIRHPPPQATGAEPSLLAGERHDLGVAAATAHEVETTLLDDATLQELLELPHHELRQPARLLHPLAKRRPALGHRLVEHAVFRSPSRVAVPTGSAVLCLPTVRGIAHARALEPAACRCALSPDRACSMPGGHWLATRPPVAGPSRLRAGPRPSTSLGGARPAQAARAVRARRATTTPSSTLRAARPPEHTSTRRAGRGVGSKAGARPHRGAFEGCPPELPGRPLEARGDARPRGMTGASIAISDLTPAGQTAVETLDSAARRSGDAALKNAERAMELWESQG